MKTSARLTVFAISLTATIGTNVHAASLDDDFKNPPEPRQLGDPGWVFDDSKYDSRIPAMKEWAKAGVQGGIPYRSSNTVRTTLSVVPGDSDMADNIQSAIRSVASSGGGVVLLKKGTYPI